MPETSVLCGLTYMYNTCIYLPTGSCRPECSLLSSTKGTCNMYTLLLPFYMQYIWNKGSDVSSDTCMYASSYYACTHIICVWKVTSITSSYSQRGDSSAAVLQVKRHILQVTTHQMAILLLFNKKTSITFQVNLQLWLYMLSLSQCIPTYKVIPH